MAFEITIPRLGWSMEEGIFGGWRKNEGDFVRRGDILFELEGEKALQEIEALDEGILKLTPNGPSPGAVLKVGAVIGYLAAANETVQGCTADSGTAEIVTVDLPVKAAEVKDFVASPSIRRLGRELGVDLSSLSGSGADGRVLEEDVRAAARSKESGDPKDISGRSRQPVITPRARRAAERIRLDWTQLSGTGKNGRIRERDVLKAAESRGAVDMSSSNPSQRTPLSGRRKVIAARLEHSVRTTVPVTITGRADATNLMSLREQFRTTANASEGRIPVPAVHDIVAKLVAAELTQHPLMGARWDGDSLVLPSADQIHLGLAVDTTEGLIVPVLRHVHTASLIAVAEESFRMIRKARDGRLLTNEMQDGVFTISNLGGFGVEFFTPVINFPETAILGLGAICKQPVATDDGQIAVRQMMPLSLTFDHRVIDGAPAARFLQSLCAAIASPAARLLASP
ncbi:MAG: dihydrolipoamide acetyltransferase family protein [Planctomycetota bacterium]